MSEQMTLGTEPNTNSQIPPKADRKGERPAGTESNYPVPR
jgi:hypothetical protein